MNLTKNLPKDLKEILNSLNRNKFKIDLEHRGLDRFIQELDKSINRLSSSLIIAALIVGSSIIMQTDRPLLLGFPVFAFLGYTFAGFIGLWWVIAILLGNCIFSICSREFISQGVVAHPPLIIFLWSSLTAN